MALRLDDWWLWDSWVVDDGERYHLFSLRAPRSLGDVERRHTAAVVGRASSTDLVTWTDHGVCFEPARGDEAPGFDDLAVWTGSVVHDGERWRMFYTGVSGAGHHVYDQRVGCAVSDDLQHWRRTSREPQVHPDSRWYTTLATRPGPTSGPDVERSSETWRDPLVRRGPGGGGWHMLLSARAAGAERNDDGVVAHATSDDLEHWELREPLTAPGAGFGQLEVLQHAVVDGRSVLVFTCHPAEMAPARLEQALAAGGACLWSVPAPADDPACGLLGPWDVSAARPVAGVDPQLFAAPLVQRRDGSWVLLGFRNLVPAPGAAALPGQGDGFEIGDPVAVTTDAQGYLVARRALGGQTRTGESRVAGCPPGEDSPCQLE